MTTLLLVCILKTINNLLGLFLESERCKLAVPNPEVQKAYISFLGEEYDYYQKTNEAIKKLEAELKDKGLEVQLENERDI